MQGPLHCPLCKKLRPKLYRQPNLDVGCLKCLGLKSASDRAHNRTLDKYVKSPHLVDKMHEKVHSKELPKNLWALRQYQKAINRLINAEFLIFEDAMGRLNELREVQGMAGR